MLNEKKALDVKMRFLKLFILLTILANPSFAADFSFITGTRDWGTKVASIQLDGPIEKGDYAEFVETYEWVLKRSDAVLTVSLNSNGGLVEEALRIGNHVREKRMGTVIKKNNECYSSCALIFLSGLYRNSSGKVGVHRSYFKRGTDLSFDELEETLGKSHDKIIDYLRDMRVPERIIEDFITTSSSEIKLITDVPNDRLYDEYVLSKCGKRPTVGEPPKFPDNPTQKNLQKHAIQYEKWQKKVFTKEFGIKRDKYNECLFPLFEQLAQSAQKK